MNLTHRQEKQLTKVLDNPKKLRKFIEDIENDIIVRAEKETKQLIDQYLDIYSIAVTYTLRYVCGLGKKRLPEVMKRIWDNVDAFRTGHISIDDCIGELKENGIEFEAIVNDKNRVKWNK